MLQGAACQQSLLILYIGIICVVPSFVNTSIIDLCYYLKLLKGRFSLFFLILYKKLPFLIGLRKGRQERRNDIIEIFLNFVNTLIIDIF